MQTVGVSSSRRAPFPLLAELPDSLRGVILDFHWSLERLHALRLPARSAAVAELSWHLSLPFWAVDGRPFQVSPGEVAASPERYPEQWRRTMAADLDYPLHGYLRADRVIILDGVHRLLKASVIGESTVSVRVLAESDFDAIAVTPDDQGPDDRS